jgi:mannitol/fructose-specific phosphotransferase system IIA component (Ntr-type)
MLITHGEVAPAIADVANRMLDVNHAHGLAMPLTQSFEKTIDEAVRMAEMVDEGKGVLLMVDMGSLTTLDRLITSRTGIQTRGISRVGTVTVIEAVRRAMLPDSDLDEIADYLLDVNSGHQWESAVSKQSVIVTTCITGKGSARRIKQMLEENMDYMGETKIMACGAVGKSLAREIEDLQKRYNVVAIAGTIDPKKKDIPFVSLESILDGSGIRMLEVLTEERGSFTTGGSLPEPERIVTEAMIIKGVKLESPGEAIELTNKCFMENGYVTSAFVESMYRREEMIPTTLDTGVAMPHGEPAHVEQPGVCILIPEKFIDWNGQKIDIVFGLALTADCIHVVEAIHRLTSKKESVQEMRLMTEEQILAVVQEEIKRYVR